MLALQGVRLARRFDAGRRRDNDVGQQDCRGVDQSIVGPHAKGTGCNVWGALAGGHDANLWKTLSECTLGYDAFGN